ncbi:MAG: hypothetical protein QGG36_28530 [Pirellulaceae bacterium]|jgi:hypothetical protein|nr:hypothetical protein [Pirellulaceae bacterium]MDP7019778.1 hypothetical protein [Pirellulaceae bacterium]
MHTVELLEESLQVAQQLGFQVRHEWLGQGGGGACEFGGQKWMFVDLALNTIEQLDQVVEALQNEPGIHTIELREELRELFELRRRAA